MMSKKLLLVKSESKKIKLQLMNRKNNIESKKIMTIKKGNIIIEKETTTRDIEIKRIMTSNIINIKKVSTTNTTNIRKEETKINYKKSIQRNLVTKLVNVPTKFVFFLMNYQQRIWFQSLQQKS